jgi:hypothetical membrane protein
MNRISRIHLIASVAAFLGVVQFVGGVVMAIRCYPTSGTDRGYSAFDNFISDLGRARTKTGTDNSASAAIFNRSVIILGAVLLPFFAIVPTTITKLRRTVWRSGTLSALGLIGIGLTPYDKYVVAHNIALGLWIGPMFILLVTHLVASSLDQQSSPARTVWTLLLAAAILAYALAGTHGGYVLMQKVTAVFAIIWFLLIGASVGTTVIRFASGRRQIIEWEAEKYLEVLQHKGRLWAGKPSGAARTSGIPDRKDRTGDS